MNKKNTNKLLKKYPKIFAQHKLDMSQTCMCWLFECDDGWVDIIDKLCEKIQLISEKSGIIVEASQVKEKFRGLRFYTDEKINNDEWTDEQKIWSSIIDGLVSRAEDLSYHTCEICGARGEGYSTGGWIKTMCKDCAKKEIRYKKIEEILK